VRAALLTIATLLILVPAAAAQDAERAAMAQIRFSTEVSAARGCSQVGSAKDNSLRDLRRKIVRAGGNLAVISFHVDDMSNIFAEIFRCGAGGPPPAGSMPPPPPVTGPPPPVGQPGPPPPPPPPPMR
jgi:hypothetical protein